MLFLMQDRKTHLLKETSQILGYLCTSHRIDIVSGDAEKEVSYIALLLSFMRSLVGHIATSDRAQGFLRSIAAMIFDERGDDPQASTGSLAAVSYAPQRWLSSVQPLTVLTTRIDDLVICIVCISYVD